MLIQFNYEVKCTIWRIGTPFVVMNELKIFLNCQFCMYIIYVLTHVYFCIQDYIIILVFNQ
jgi:hypothetical protein